MSLPVRPPPVDDERGSGEHLRAELSPLAERGPVTHVLAGFVVASSDGQVLSTVLGSCVALCLFDPEAGVGGMNHYMLPHGAAGPHASARFGNVALDALFAAVRGRGAYPERLRAKIFGGACVLDALASRPDHLGGRNARVALDFLEHRGIPLVASDVGGRRGRKLLFRTSDGAALVRSL